MLRAPLPTTLNYNLAIHSNDSFWTVQKDQASLSAVLPTTPRRPVQAGRLRCGLHYVNNDNRLSNALWDRGRFIGSHQVTRNSDRSIRPNSTFPSKPSNYNSLFSVRRTSER